MNILIVEDESMARRSLSNTLKRLYADFDIIGETGSVMETVSWLQENGDRTDLIFMDVELSDGNCFEIFRQIDVNAHVIMTTAYDHYAIKAFEVDSIDYLLKPVGTDELKRAVERVRSQIALETASGSTDSRTEPSPSPTAGSRPKRERFLIKLNDRILPVKVSDIAYFYSEDKSTYIITSDARKYVADFSLDMAMEQLDGKDFFRISRNCIISMRAVDSIVKIGSRYMISSIPPPPTASMELVVSRSKTEDFIKWLESI